MSYSSSKVSFSDAVASWSSGSCCVQKFRNKRRRRRGGGEAELGKIFIFFDNCIFKLQCSPSMHGMLKHALVDTELK